LDYAVNCASIGAFIKMTDPIPKDDLEKFIAVNTTAVWQ
jgi:NAD(P)-dependent dehydrogenase (short-subunit alcohol dehydrogenase family)